MYVVRPERRIFSYNCVLQTIIRQYFKERLPLRLVTFFSGIDKVFPDDPIAMICSTF